jgi:hypothetical protein
VANPRVTPGERIELLHAEGGRLVEIWNYADVMGLAAQMASRDPFGLEF